MTGNQGANTKMIDVIEREDLTHLPRLLRRHQREKMEASKTLQN
jgi:ATP adenylyltransferase/5',5'''-P-1,P-4-tetraphosphate phosphorylase II